MGGYKLIKDPFNGRKSRYIFLPHNKVTINVNIILLDAFPSVTDASVGWYTVAIKDIVKVKAFEKFLHFLISEVLFGNISALQSNCFLQLQMIYLYLRS